MQLAERVSQPAGQDTVEVVSFSADGRRIAAGLADGVVAIFNLADTDATPVVAGLHAGFVSALAWSPDGSKLLTAADNGSVCLSDGASLRVLRTFTAYPFTYPAVAWSPDGRQFALAQGKEAVQVIDAQSGAVVRTYSLPGVTTRALEWLASGQIAVSDTTGVVSFFGPNQAGAMRTFKPALPHKAVNSLAISPDERTLAVAYDDGAVLLLDPATATQVGSLPQGRETGTVTWSPNGRLLAVTSVAFDVSLFDAGGKPVAREDLGYDTNGTAWSPDGRYLSAGADDHTFRIWQVSPPQAPATAYRPPPTYMGR